MIGIALRTDIETWAARRNERSLFHMARDGRLTTAMVKRYIANVTWSIRRTAGHMKDARDRALELGNERIAKFYAEKIHEEAGHEAWGDADLESLTRLVAAPPEITAAFVDIDAYVTEIIEKDPSLYLAYLALAEYVTVLLGPELLQNIQDHCGVPRTSMTVVDNHIELDRDHAEENFGVLDDLVGDPRMLAPLREALAKMLGFFDRFCEEVTEIVPAAVRGHVSAA
jgi:hypothetical protein